MNATVGKLAEQALLLSPADRDELVEAILSSTEPDEEWMNEWIDECKRRMEMVRSGQSQTIPAEDVFRMMDAAARPES